MTMNLQEEAGLSWHPLTEAQEGIWYAQARRPDTPAFMTGQALHLDGPLDQAALRAALADLGAEADCLRMRLRVGPDGRPVHCLDPDFAPRLAVVDLSDAPETASARIMAEARSPVALVDAPLARFTLWVLGPARHILTERIHHLAADGQAMVQITRRLAALYNARCGAEGAGAPLAPYARALEEDTRFRAAPARAAQRAFWHAALADLPVIEEIAVPETAASAHSLTGDGRWFHRHELTLPSGLCADLARQAEAAGVHWTDVAVALAGAFVGRHMPLVSRGDSACVVLGIPLQNRFGKLARVPSTQVNVLPFMLPLDEAQPLGQWLARAGADLARIRRHPRYRGEALARETGRIGGGRRLWGPLVNILPFEARPAFTGCRCRLEILSAGSVDDLTICYRGDPENGLLLQVDANDGRYCAEWTTAFAMRFAAFLAAAMGAVQLRDVPSLTAAETRIHLEERNRTAHPVARGTLWDLMAARMAQTPEACAVRMGQAALSYGELDRRSAALAAHLAALGAGPGRVVAIALPRSLDLIVALVSVMRAGAAYVPLDPDDRSARSRDMLEHSAPVAIFAPPGYPCNGITQVGAPYLAGEIHPSGPDDLAYILFTSGSTGAPKGVMVTQEAIVNRLEWMRETYGFGPQDRILQKTPATFDVSVWEFFLPFLSGATLVVAPPETHRDPAALAALIRSHQITAVHFVPSMLDLFLAAPASAGLVLPRVFASGEALPQRLAQRFAQRITGHLHNLYGPTEAAVDVTFAKADPAALGAQVPIGRPVWNTACYLLDRFLRPVPDGVAGRLYLAGRQLARGYLGRPDLTAERFLPTPFASEAARGCPRIYDTGDLAVAGPQGDLRFVGRVDDQVKIRGVRIETGEIEASIAADPAIRQVAILADEDSAGQARLLAYVVPSPDAGLDGAALRAVFEARLPAMMQPAHILTVAELPLNRSGKLDRKALPRPEGSGTTGTPPRGHIEKRLARLYAEVLEEPAPVPRETDFFLAGGDSLRAVRLALRIEEETGRDPGLGVILEYPVLADLAARLEEAFDAGIDTGLDRGPDQGTGPLLRLQAGHAEGPVIFAVHPAGGLAWCYRALAQALPQARVYGLQSPLLAERDRTEPPSTGQPNAGAPSGDGQTGNGPSAASLNTLAALYLDRIAQIWPIDRPVLLLGWSLGGIIAHAMAAQAEARGWPLARLVLLDAYPSECWRDQPEPDDAMALRALLAIAGFDPEAHRALDTPDRITGFLRAQGHPLARLPAPVLAGVMRAVKATNRLVREHREPVVETPVLHVAALRDQQGTTHHAGLWSTTCRDLAQMACDCTHPDMVSPRIARAVAEEITRAMQAAQCGDKPPCTEVFGACVET